MKRVILLFLFVWCVNFLTAGNIDIQFRRLEYLQRLIEQKRERIDEAKNLKVQSTEKKIIYQHDYSECEERLNNLHKLEHQVLEELIRKQHDVEITNKNIEKTKSLWEKQIVGFYLNKFIHYPSQKQSYYEYYFPEIINRTSSNINDNKEMLIAIHSGIADSRNRQQKIRKQQESERKNIKTLSGEISRLSNTIDSLSTDEIAYLEEIQSLERNREALESLIAHLQSDEYKVSYRFTNDKLRWPFKGQITNHFGEVFDETYNFVIVNNGIDIVSNTYQDIYAVDFGIVVFSETFRNYGKMIIIDHQNGYFSLYANNENLLVTKGDIVALGQPIAKAGRKNNSSEYMLHFELRRHNVPVNPLDYLESD